MHKIKLTKTGKEESFWTEVKSTDTYLQLIDPLLEKGSPSEIAAALIKQFNETDEKLRPVFLKMLVEWLSNISEDEYGSEKIEKIKDSIYEMF